jgi:hypothetical protein
MLEYINKNTLGRGKWKLKENFENQNIEPLQTMFCQSFMQRRKSQIIFDFLFK